MVQFYLWLSSHYRSSKYNQEGKWNHDALQRCLLCPDIHFAPACSQRSWHRRRDGESRTQCNIVAQRSFENGETWNMFLLKVQIQASSCNHWDFWNLKCSRSSLKHSELKSFWWNPSGCFFFFRWNESMQCGGRQKGEKVLQEAAATETQWDN